MPFTQKTLAFLSENWMRDDREWFHAHKEAYERDVIAPFAELVTQVGGGLLAIDGELCFVPKVGRTISRIWRDTRFAKDKTIFRAEMWCNFGEDKRQNRDRPSFFFAISPRGWQYGCGHYAARPAEMEWMRKLIFAQDEGWVAAQKAYAEQDLFELLGDTYKRSKAPNASPEVRAWVERKTVYFLHQSTDFEALYREDLAQRVLKDFLKIAPIYAFYKQVQAGVPKESLW